MGPSMYMSVGQRDDRSPRTNRIGDGEREYIGCADPRALRISISGWRNGNDKGLVCVLDLAGTLMI